MFFFFFFFVVFDFLFFFFFFFQAEDGIRDGRVTGVQTCALPIFGLALTFDEFGMWFHLGGAYSQRASFDAVAIIVGLLGLLSIAPTIRHFRWKDRKSTRLNSSHPSTSYAVFCLKKKNIAQSPAIS